MLTSKMHLGSLLATAVLPLATLVSQSVLTVGPTGQYADLPAAVAAAQPGDTVRCIQWPPFQQFTAPVVNKALTIDGSGAHMLVGQTLITNIAAGDLVIFRGFVNPTSHDIRVVDCAGRVHLDSVFTSTSAPGVWPATSIEVVRCDAVTLHRVITHGSPAVSATDSVVAIEHCKFGRRAGGNLAGGRSLEALRSTVTIVQPEGDVGYLPISTIFADQSDLTITGRWESGGSGSIRGGLSGGSQFPAVEGVNSTLTLSPSVALYGGTSGFPTVTMHETPYQRVFAKQPGASTALETFGPINAIAVAGLSLPVGPLPSPLGSLWINPVSVVTYGLVLDHVGRHYLNVPVPLATPVGSTWTLQGAVLTSSGLELTLPATFTIRN